jgi:hypothetical protein
MYFKRSLWWVFWVYFEDVCTFWQNTFFFPLVFIKWCPLCCLATDLVWFELTDDCFWLLHTPAPSVHQFDGHWTSSQSKTARPPSCRSASHHAGTWESGAGCKESEQKGMKLQVAKNLNRKVWSYRHIFFALHLAFECFFIRDVGACLKK